MSEESMDEISESGPEADIAREIKDLKTEVRELKNLVNVLINMMMEIEPLDSAGPDRNFPDDSYSEFLLYN